MVLYRRILSLDDGIDDCWYECNYTSMPCSLNVSCNAFSPPSSDIVPIDIADSSRHLSDVVIIAISVIAAVFLLSVTCYAYAIFRRRRHRRHSLPPHAAASVPCIEKSLENILKSPLSTMNPSEPHSIFYYLR